MPIKSLKPRLMATVAAPAAGKPEQFKPAKPKMPQRDGLAKTAKDLSKRFIGG